MLKPASVIAFLALLSCALSLPAHTEERVATLGFVQATGLDTSNDALRPTYEYAQEGGNPLWLEAERASVIRFTPGKGRFAADPEASGGLYVAHVDHLEFHFEIKEPGAYTAWYRGSFPLKGHWNHSENMDGGETHIVTDSQGEVLNEWTWTKGPTYELTAGQHSWNLTPAGWCGGAGLDKVLLVKDAAFRPEGLGGPAAAPVAPARGEAVTETFSRRNVVRWGTLTVENPGGKGTVGVAYSTDAGRTWQPLPPGGDLSAVPADKPLTFRLSLEAGADGSPPYVSRVQLTYLTRQVPPLVLENDRMQLRFSGENGALVGIRNKVTKTEYMDSSVETPLFSFTGFRPEFKTVVEIGFGQAELKKVTGPAGGEMTLAYELMGGAIQATVKVRLDGALARFSLNVSNNSVYDISQVRLLSLKGLRIGEDCTDDYLVTPIMTGCIAKYPAALEYPRTAYTDRPLGYPGMATMCWMDLWDDRGGGLYYACEDKQYRLTELTFSNGAEDRPRPEATGAPLPPTEAGWRFASQPGTYVNLGFDKRMLVNKRTGPVQVPEVVIGVHEGDWHWGADRYREWAEPWMTKLRDVPDWLRDVEGWTDCHMIHLGRFVDLSKGRPKGARRITMQDPPFPIIAMWAQMASCEAYWATPVLHRLLGTEEEFRAGVQKHHEMGHRFISYNLPSNINPTFHRGPGGMRAGIVPLSMYPDDEVPPAGFYPEVGVRLYDGALRSPDGVYCEANVCMAATKWQEYNRHIVLDKYCRDYLNDGMYLDGGGLYDLGTQDCKNLEHGHDNYGVWANGFLEWLGQIKAEARKSRPGAIFAGEGMGDIYLTGLDLSLFYADNAPQVYRYTCPWNIGVIHGYEMPCFPFSKWPEGYMELAAVYGLKFGATDWTFDKHPERAARLLAFRQRFSQFQFRSRFVDDQGLQVGDAAVHAKLYVRNDAGNRGALVVAYNPEQKECPVAVTRERVGALRSAWCYDAEAQLRPLQVRTEGDKYTFTLPATEIVAVLLLERSEPFLALDKVAPVVPGESGQARVTVTNLEDKEISGQVSLRLPAGWKAASQNFTLASGQSRSFLLTFQVPPGTKYDVYDIYAVTRDGNRVTDKCVPMGACRPVQAELHWLNRDTLRLAMVNSSGKPVSGTCRLLVPAGVTVEPQDAPFSLPARGTSELVLRLSNVESIVTLEHFKAVLRYGEDLTEAYEVLQPPLLNGGFEQSTGGDGWPDYWNYRSPETLYLKGAVLDTEDKVEGKQSLRLEPNPHENANAILSTFVRLAPNTRYRVSCAIKCSDWQGVGVHLFSFGAQDPARRVDVYLGGKEGTPTGTWQRFEAEFMSADIEVPYEIGVSNWGKRTTPVWYDDIRIEEVR